MTSLVVRCGDAHVGDVDVDESERFAFTYAKEWLASAGSFPISLSLPFRDLPYREPAAHAFFANLLPEGEVRTMVARRLGISVDNDFELLAAIGGECAGALTIGVVPDESSYSSVSLDTLDRYAREGDSLAEVTGHHGVRLSLAGAQDKLAVLADERGIHIPRGRAASSHILKFPNHAFAHLPMNEAFTASLAGRLGLPTCETKLWPLPGRPVLLVTRYDRYPSGTGQIRRLHQEDLCQALGISPRRKYESEGGPSFAQCYRLVVDHSTDPVADGMALLRWLAFNAVVGNADGHGKNLSMVRSDDGQLRLAPFYDLVCTAAYPRIDRHLAMPVGATSDAGQIRGADWEQLARDIAVAPRLMLGTVKTVAERAEQVARDVADEPGPLHGESPAFQMILPVIRKRSRRILRQL